MYIRSCHLCRSCGSWYVVHVIHLVAKTAMRCATGISWRWRAARCASERSHDFMGKSFGTFSASVQKVFRTSSGKPI